MHNALLLHRSQLIILALFTLGLAPLPLLAEPILTDARANRAWKDGKRIGELEYKPDSGREMMLVLRKELFQDPGRGLKMLIKSDAREIVFSAGSKRLKLRLATPKIVTLQFTGKGKSTTVSRDRNQLLASDLKTWRKLLFEGREETLNILFVGGKKAYIGFLMRDVKVDLHKAPPTQSNSSIRRRPGPPTKPSTPKTPTQPNTPHRDLPGTLNKFTLATLAKSVFQIVVDTVDPRVKQTAPAYLVSSSGFAITSFHAIQGAKSASAKLTPASAPVPVELYAVRPELDLALIKLHRTSVAGRPLTPLQLDPHTPRAGQAVWVIGPSSSAGPSISQGRITAVRPYRRLPFQVAKNILTTAPTTWLLSTARVDHRNAGGPMVNSLGKVIGMSAWTWHTVNSARPETFSLSASELRQLIAKPPTKPFTFTRAATEFANTRTPFLAFPTLTIVQNRSSSELAAAASAFKATLTCTRCRGHGTISSRTSTGPDTKKPCPRCQQTGLANHKRMYVSAKHLAHIAAGLDKNDKRLPAIFANIRTSIDTQLKENPARIYKRLNNESASAFTRWPAPVGTPIAVMGKLNSTQSVTDAGKNIRFVVFSQTRNGLMLRNPILVDDTAKSAVFVGGLLAGYVRTERGQIVPVIENAFILALPTLESKSSPRR